MHILSRVKEKMCTRNVLKKTINCCYDINLFISMIGSKLNEIKPLHEEFIVLLYNFLHYISGKLLNSILIKSVTCK